MAFQVGDVVKLKSGSPTMTVVEYDAEYDLVTAKWHDGKEVKIDTSPSAALEKVR